ARRRRRARPPDDYRRGEGGDQLRRGQRRHDPEAGDGHRRGRGRGRVGRHPRRAPPARDARGAVHRARGGLAGAGVKSPQGGESADLRHVTTWLFDLDNTLYPLESGLGVAISDRITDYTQRLTGLPREEARALQKRYLDEHGLTLRGLMLHHGVDPDDYHAQFQDLSLEALASDAGLTAAIARLPGRRLVFTNADAGHAGRVLRRLDLEHLFDDVFHI